MSDTPALRANGWVKDLRDLGFTPAAGGQFQRRQGLTFQTERDWGVLRATASTPTVRGDCLGQPGLWKALRIPQERPCRVFEFPPQVMVSADADGLPGDDDESLFHAHLTWALATLHGEVPKGWRSPTAEEIQALLSPSGLTVQAGDLLRQGKWIRDASRLALRFPILERIDRDLPENRQVWLRRVLADANQRTRLVRAGLDEGCDALAAVAEIDLSGAPTSLLGDLVRMGMEALQWLVAWVARTVEVIANPRIRVLALDACLLRT